MLQIETNRTVRTILYSQKHRTRAKSATLDTRKNRTALRSRSRVDQISAFSAFSTKISPPTLINFRLDIFANLIRYCLSFPYDDDDDEQCCLPFHPTPSSRTDASSWLHSRYVRDCVPLGSLSITLHAALRANKYPHNHT
jgi:hypothetical protein